MIREIINFTNNLEQDVIEVFSWNIKPSEGLHIFLNMNVEKKFDDFEFVYYSEKNDKGGFYSETIIDNIKKYETNGRRIGTK